MRTIASFVTVGPYGLKVINSLVHGGPYVAVYLGKKRVAWVSFKTKKATGYSTTGDKELSEIHLVNEWFEIIDNYNLAGGLWNSFANGAYVTLLTKEKR